MEHQANSPDGTRPQEDRAPPPPLGRTISGAIRQWRKTQRLTQAQLADALELTRAMVELMECGKRSPGMRTLQKLVDQGVLVVDVRPALPASAGASNDNGASTAAKKRKSTKTTKKGNRAA